MILFKTQPCFHPEIERERWDYYGIHRRRDLVTFSMEVTSAERERESFGVIMGSIEEEIKCLGMEVTSAGIMDKRMADTVTQV